MHAFHETPLLIPLRWYATLCAPAAAASYLRRGIVAALLALVVMPAAHAMGHMSGRVWLQQPLGARRHLAAIGLPTGLDALPRQAWRAETLVAHMHQAKKVRNGKVTFILVRGIGDAFIEPDVVLADVEKLLALSTAACPAAPPSFPEHHPIGN